MADPLPLDSPRWRTLSTWAGSGADVPKLIRQLQRDPGVIGDTTYAALSTRIFQQYNCSAAGVAAYPYLVELLGRVSGKDRGELLSLLGLLPVLAHLADAPADLLPAFEEAITAAEVVCIQYLVETDTDLLATYYTAAAAVAMTRQPLDRLVRDSYWPNAKVSTYAVCPSCKKRVLVAVFDTGLVTRPSDRVAYPDPPSPGEPPEPPVPAAPVKRDPNPWVPMAAAIQAYRSREPVSPELAPHFDAAFTLASNGLTDETNPSAVFSLIGVMFAVKGHLPQAGRYLHACDHIECPHCKTRFRFADRWWQLPL